MSWVDYMTARQQLTDEFVGVLVRESQRMDAAKVEATKAAIRKQQGVTPVPRRPEPTPEPLIVNKGETVRGRAY